MSAPELLALCPLSDKNSRQKNDDHGSGALAQGKGSAAQAARRRRLFELVWAYGARSRRERSGTLVGPDALFAHLDTSALQRSRTGEMAGREPQRDAARAERPLSRNQAADRETQIGASRAGTRGARGAQRLRVAHQRAISLRSRGPRRITARSATNLRDLYCGPLEYTGARRRAASGNRPPGRTIDVQSALHPRRRGIGQDPFAAGDNLGRQQY